MKHAVLIVASAAACSVSFAQPQLECDGYVVTLPAHLRVNEALASLNAASRDSWSSVTRLRLRPMLHLSETGFVALEYEAASTYQSGFSALMSPAAGSRRQLVGLNWEVVSSSRWHIMHSIDRLYYRQQFSAFDLSIGRQRIAWGSGRIWNPTDLFNPLNPTTFSKLEKDGIDAATLKLTLGAFSDLTLVYNPQHDTPSNYALRVRTHASEFDVIGIGGYFDQHLIVGGDIAGNVLDAGVRSEFIASLPRHGPSRSFVKVILGADYQWTGELYTLMEYHYNGEGETHPAQYALSRVAAGELLNVGTDYLAIGASYLVHPLVTTSVTCTRNLRDGSMYVALSGVYLPSDEISLTLGGQVFTGDPLEEYSYYPSACYAKLEMFF